MAILIMGYGDGLAAIIGERYGKRPVQVFGGYKSFAGTSTMFVVSLGVALIFRAVVIASIASFVEFVTPMGLDNLTVPIAVALLYPGFLQGGVAFEFIHPFIGLAANIIVGYLAYSRGSVSFFGMLAGVAVFFVIGGSRLSPRLLPRPTATSGQVKSVCSQRNRLSRLLL